MFRSARSLFNKPPSDGGNRWLIVGLGNPGKKYSNTRHNVGFEMVDAIGDYYDISIAKLKCRALIGEGKIGQHSVILAKPQTYMNLSGESVRELAAYYKVPPQRLVAIYDDMALPSGKVRIRPQGSAGGHNGMKNIIYHMKTDAFPRVRVGIGEPQGDVIDYVLHGFSKEETAQLVEKAKEMPGLIRLLIEEGVPTAMNQYNG